MDITNMDTMSIEHSASGIVIRRGNEVIMAMSLHIASEFALELLESVRKHPGLVEEKPR